MMTRGIRGLQPTSVVDAERLTRLQQLTDATLAHLRLDDLLAALLARTREALEVDTCAVLLLDEERNELVARAADGLEAALEQGVRIPVGEGFAGRVAAERRPVILEDVDHADVLNPVLREQRIRSLLGVPLVVESRMLGVLHVGTVEPRRFDEDDVELLQLVGDRAAIAIEHARLYEAELQKREAEANAANAAKTDIGWGHQIRSYVLQPYQLVKDLRTGTQSTNPAAVLDGEIDPFIEAALAQRIHGGGPAAIADLE